MLHCFNCGADLPSNIVYCLHCGERLDASGEFETQIRAPKVALTQAKKKSFTWLWVKTIAAALCLLLGVGGVIAILATLFNSAEKQNNSFNESGRTNTFTEPQITPSPVVKKTPDGHVTTNRKKKNSAANRPSDYERNQRIANSVANAQRAANYARDFDYWVSAKCRDGGGESRRLAWGLDGICRDNGGVSYWEVPPPSNVKRP